MERLSARQVFMDCVGEDTVRDFQKAFQQAGTECALQLAGASEEDVAAAKFKNYVVRRHLRED